MDVTDTAPFDDLMRHIQALPGRKILTLIDAHRAREIDMDEQGALDTEPVLAKLFEAALHAAIDQGGALIIRQFLPLRTRVTTQTGAEHWLPIKNIYGARLGKGAWEALTPTEMRLAHTTDAETGAPIDPEPNTRFPPLPSPAHES